VGTTKQQHQQHLATIARPTLLEKNHLIVIILKDAERPEKTLKTYKMNMNQEGWGSLAPLSQMNV
jgi:hypothetical protein